MEDGPAPVRRGRKVDEVKEFLTCFVGVRDTHLFIVIFVLYLAETVGERVKD